MKTLFAFLAGAVLAAGSAFAADLAKADREFLLKAAAGNQFELEASRLAQTRAIKEDVKGYGSALVQDHGKAGDELKALAAAKGVTLPTALPADLKKRLDKLATTKQFDAEFLGEVGVRDHRKDIALFEKASRTARDKDVKAFAAKTLPLLKAHRTHAEAILGGKT